MDVARRSKLPGWVSVLVLTMAFMAVGMPTDVAAERSAEVEHAESQDGAGSAGDQIEADAHGEDAGQQRGAPGRDRPGAPAHAGVPGPPPHAQGEPARSGAPSDSDRSRPPAHAGQPGPPSHAGQPGPPAHAGRPGGSGDTGEPEPARPNQPAPSTPTQPTDPGRPTNPNPPASPAQPTDPRPTNPSPPTAPGRPANPEQPAPPSTNEPSAPGAPRPPAQRPTSPAPPTTSPPRANHPTVRPPEGPGTPAPVTDRAGRAAPDRPNAGPAQDHSPGLRSPGAGDGAASPDAVARRSAGGAPAGTAVPPGPRSRDSRPEGMAPASLPGGWARSGSPLFGSLGVGASTRTVDETEVLATAPRSREAGGGRAGPAGGHASVALPDDAAAAGSSPSLGPRPPFAPSLGIAPGPEEGRVPWALVGTVLLGVIGFAGAVPAALQARRRVRTRRRGDGAPAPTGTAPAAGPAGPGSAPEAEPSGPRRGPVRPIPVAPLLITPPNGAPANGGARNGAPANGAPAPRPTADPEPAAFTAPEPAKQHPPAPSRPAPTSELEPGEPGPPRPATLAHPVGLVAVVAVDKLRVNGRENGAPSAAPAADAPEPVRAAAPLSLDEQMRSLKLEARLATVSLTLLPVLVAAVRAVADPTFPPRLLTSVVGLLVLLVAASLSVVGAWWLSGLHAAPFPAFPWRRREHAGGWEAEAQLAGLLEAAAGLARHGRSLDDAVTDAAAREPTPAATALRAGVANATLELPVESGAAAGRSGLVALCAQALRADVARGIPAQTALTSSAARLRLSCRQRLAQRHARLPVTALLPFATCLLPATILLAIVGW